MEELESLISRAQAGDLDAYGRIVQQFQDMAVGYAFSILGDFHLAEDAVQEAFIEAYPILSRVYGPIAFPGWFRRIIFKHCNRLTRGKRDELMPLETMVEIPSGRRDPADEIEEQETKSLVLAAVRRIARAPASGHNTLLYQRFFTETDCGLPRGAGDNNR